MRLEDLAAPPVRLRLRGNIDELTQKLARRAALNAAHLFGLAAGVLLRRLREMNEPLASALAQATEEQFKAAFFARAPDLIGARFDKLPERKRPFYTPAQRFQILELKNLLGWPADQVAKLFRVCTHTILNLEKNADPASNTVGSTVKPTTPIMRFAAVVRNTVQLMAGHTFGNDRAVALLLARAGWNVSARSVARIKREKPRRKPTPPTTDTRHQATHPVIARFVHHVWMMDVSEVQAFLGGTFYLATVFDAFARTPLVLQTYQGKPGASAMAKLLKAAVRTVGKAKYVITDQGKEFTGKVFRKTAARLGIIYRFGTKDRIFATARLERFWKALKQLANVKADQPLTLEDLEARLQPVLTYYLCLRPHLGMQGATPAEVFLGADPAGKNAVTAPRGRAGEGAQDPPFAIGFLDPDRRALPILKKTA